MEKNESIEILLRQYQALTNSKILILTSHFNTATLCTLLKVIFKYVGQGDCIIIDWQDETGHKVGIIDCHAPGDRNPVVEHLKMGGFSELDFVILSHPHYDHYSGLLGVLEFCEQAGLSIKRFGHTSREARAYLRAVVMSRGKKNRLTDLFIKIKELESAGVIQHRGLLSDNTMPIPLASGVAMTFLAPSENEYDTFLKTLYDNDLNPKTNPDANWLSTIALIRSDSWYALLTSDSEIDAQRRIGIKILRKESRKLILGQLPHHGSANNYEREFWKRQLHEADTPIAISLGPNHHGHPSLEAISSLESLQYSVYTTGRLERKRNKEVIRIRSALNVVSSPVTPKVDRETDLVYELRPGKAELIAS